MKKSKLIVPAALAVMLLSTAASVTGTVAWFTANRAVTINADNFEVVSTDGSLSYELAAGNCTTVSGSGTSAKVSVTSGKKLTDASVDFSTASAPRVFTDEALDTGAQPNTFSEITLASGTFLTANSYAVPSTNNTVFYCATWKITFSYDFNGGPTSVDLFFNGAESTMAYEKTRDALNDATTNTYTGFRVGMATSTKAIVFADYETLGHCNYITQSGSAAAAPASSAAAGSYAAYTLVSASGGNLVDSSITTSTLALAVDGQNGNTTRGDYLGTITKPANATTGTFELNCFAWFEGTDQGIVNNSEFHKMSCALKFYTRRPYSA